MNLNGYNAKSELDDPALGAAVSLFREFQTCLNAAVAANMTKLVNEPSWGLLQAMYERAEDQLEACIVLISNHYFAPAEALSRTAIEAAVNLYYCSVDDSEGKFLSYFKHYVTEERSQNEKWLKSVERSTKHNDEDKEY
jgi:hypothetical protein